MYKQLFTLTVALFSVNAYAQDTDGDGIPDATDNCVAVANADQRDSNFDNFGNVCDADLNNDCSVDSVDLGLIRAAFFSNNQSANWNPDADLDGDGRVHPSDLRLIRQGFPNPRALMRRGFPNPPGPGMYACQAPNVLFVLLDDVGIDPMPQYADGSPQKAVTPTMDQLAADGIVFDNVWVNPTCSPTRSTAVTGRYGVRTGILNAGGGMGLPLTETSLQSFIETNSPVDYATGAFGKWHINGMGFGVDHPNLLGIEHYAGLIGNVGMGNSYFGDWTFTENGVQTLIDNEYVTTRTTDETIEWIGEQEGGPWFTWFAQQSPHGPFHVPPDPMTYTTDPATNPDPNSNLFNYIAMLESVDYEVDRILDSLEPAERAFTTVIVLGDNGTPAGVYQGASPGAKGSLYQGGLLVPMIVSGHRVARSGEREDALVNGTDVFATIAELVGTGTKIWQDSISHLDQFTQDLPGARAHAYSDGSRGDGRWAVRNMQYKLIRGGFDPDELYDLSTDPNETDNLLVSDPTNPNVVVAHAELQMVGAQIRN